METRTAEEKAAAALAVFFGMRVETLGKMGNEQTQKEINILKEEVIPLLLRDAGGGVNRQAVSVAILAHIQFVAGAVTQIGHHTDIGEFVRSPREALRIIQALATRALELFQSETEAKD